MRGPGWWRPAPGVLLLAVPYSLPGSEGGVGIGVYEVGPAGARYVTHMPEVQPHEGGDGSAFALSVGDDRRLWVYDSIEMYAYVVSIGVEGTRVEMHGQSYMQGRPDGPGRDPRVPPQAAP